jgi:hypothetical protein
MLLDPMLASKLEFWRARQAAGQMTVEDWTQVFTDLRQARSSAQAASAASKKSGGKKKAAKAPVDTAALKAGLLALKAKT